MRQSIDQIVGQMELGYVALGEVYLGGNQPDKSSPLKFSQRVKLVKFKAWFKASIGPLSQYG
jgi:hypothetical protein